MQQPQKTIRRVVLAYSGGLDTSIILKWLQTTYGCEVVTFTADLGQGEELEPARQKAILLGIKPEHIFVEDLRDEFVRDYVFPMFRANAQYEGLYLLGTSIARPLIAKKQIEIARAVGADAVAHGATGKGNDQVRFELAYYALEPDINVIAPWREWDLTSRTALLDFAEKNQIPIAKDKRGEAPFSVDANLLHVSSEGKVLEDPAIEVPEYVYSRTLDPEQAPDQPTYIEIDFERGDPIAIDGEALGPAALLARLNALGRENGIGRLDLVENRFVGMKSRGMYETPGGTILYFAHRGIEQLTLDRGAAHLKDEFMPRYAELIYNGFWFSPERELLQLMIDKSQDYVSGRVRLKLYKGLASVVGRSSPHSLYDQDLVTFEEGAVAYDHRDAAGFIKLNALRLRTLAKRNRRGGDRPGAMPTLTLTPRLRGLYSRRNRTLVSGIVLGLFLLMHFANVALGLVSIAAMDEASPWLMAPWRTLPGAVLLLGALGVHFGSALQALYGRRTLKMRYREGAQLALGLLIPFLLASHVVASRIEPALTGHAANYAAEIHNLWIKAPLKGVQQGALLIIVWAHACLGLWFWLRTKRWFLHASGYLLTAAVLLPILALLGFAEAGKQAAELPPPPEPVPVAGLIDSQSMTWVLYALFGGAIGGVMGARRLRQWQGRHSGIRVTYPGGQVVLVPKGSSVLEASRLANVPHASMCGGRGRCSTCRVRVQAGLDRLPAPRTQEQATLARFKARPDIRLACQLRPTQDLTVYPVFASARAMPTHPGRGAPAASSHERELAILFCDLRGFTRRAEQALPFDTVFLLNRYFEVVGEAVQRAGGYLDKFIGDGALALFGLDTEPDVACRHALAAAAGIARGLEELNAHLAGGLSEPLRIAMGLHAGPAIVGEMGYGDAVGLTAIGDGINVASRLETAAKEFDAEAVVSIDLARRAGLDLSIYTRHEIIVRGRNAPVDALLIKDAANLAGLIQA